MNVADSRRLLIVAWLTLVGVTIARETQAGYIPPRPAVFIPGAFTYTVFGVLGEVAPVPALMLAGLFDLAALLTPFLKNPQTSPLASLFNWLDSSGVLGGGKK